MSIDLNSMVVFARVVEEKGFSAAARKLGLSKSAVSKHVTQLEDRIGARLLHRTTRRLSLTDVGAAFYERCARIVAEAEEAELAVSHMQAAPRGTLRLSAPFSFGNRYLAPAVADFLVKYPEVNVDMTLNDRLVDLVDEGYDMAVRIGRLADSSLVARKLCPMPGFVCASPDYVARHGMPQRPQDLVQHNCLLYTYLSSGDTWHFHDGGDRIGVQVHGNLRANNGDALQAAALAGLGIAMQPAFICGPDLISGRLVEVLADYRDSPYAVYAVYPHGRHLSAKVRAFVDFLAERFADQPWSCQAAQHAAAAAAAA